MRTKTHTQPAIESQKRTYKSPVIERVVLDHEISMVMSSATPPTEPFAIPGMDEYLQKMFKFRW
jgi:hypothetical protein